MAAHVSALARSGSLGLRRAGALALAGDGRLGRGGVAPHERYAPPARRLARSKPVTLRLGGVKARAQLRVCLLGRGRARAQGRGGGLQCGACLRLRRQQAIFTRHGLSLLGHTGAKFADLHVARRQTTVLETLFDT